MALVSRTGTVSFLRAHDVGTGYGPPDDQIDVEAVVQLEDVEGAFGFQLRDDDNRATRQAMFDLLRDSFQHGHETTIEYNLEEGRQNGIIIRVALNK